MCNACHCNAILPLGSGRSGCHRGLTQQQLADRIERSTERGVSLPTFETLDRLAAVLEVPVHEFFDLDARADPKREALLLGLRASARAMSDDDLALAAVILDLMAKRNKETREQAWKLITFGVSKLA